MRTSVLSDSGTDFVFVAVSSVLYVATPFARGSYEGQPVCLYGTTEIRIGSNIPEFVTLLGSRVGSAVSRSEIACARIVPATCLVIEIHPPRRCVMLNTTQ